ncbi:MAG: bifunctional aldolase/short-chain dehydrogenase [Deltaproteobacteria bacterium]|nr:MAG: bifunctional aldolase/short-chain dehydrogenase [Deltaproteobacteria bacterium]
MRSRWSDEEAARFVARYGARWGEELALRTYTSRLLGAEDRLVLHGGGNTSVKGTFTNRLGETIPALYVKASGHDLATLEPEGLPGLDLGYLRKLRALETLDDDAMANELRTHLFDARSATPSLETLVHAFLPEKFVDHTHADAILALSNQAGGERVVREALGDDITVLGYVRPGLQLARAVADAYEATPGRHAMVWMRHGLMTWGPTARGAYEAMIEIVTRAETYLARKATGRVTAPARTSLDTALARVRQVAPVLRGCLAEPTGEPDRPHRRVIVRPLITPEVLAFVDSQRGRELALTPPLTSDHLIRTKALPLWIDRPGYDEPARLAEQVREAVRSYAADYRAYVERHAARLPAGLARFDALPRVALMPGLGALCAGGDVRAASIARDITVHTLAVKAQVSATGVYEGLPEAELFDMEYHGFQHAKLGAREAPLAGEVAIVTGAAGAIGSGICQTLLEHGCHVAATDLPGKPLDALVAELGVAHGPRVIGVPLDVTDATSVADAFASVAATWGGVDVVVVNAGLAHVAGLAELDLESFRRLERVNVEGALLVMAEAGRHLGLQGTGGDIVLVSTKNVFAPGAKFGAYSATKAAAHQLARIASLELAEIDVRVNMVAPDAVFSHHARRSGLWATVGPDRMRARGLDEAGLEDYYRSRNLLKARITAEHVGRAVLFFATRQTPTTGATIPVDGGLPDATPR